jgi:hemolysin activation/secretion protein
LILTTPRGKHVDPTGDVGHLYLLATVLWPVPILQANAPFGGFQVATLNGGATIELTKTLSAQLLFSGQYAFSSLPAAVFGFYGGETFGRAYDPGSLAGHHLVSAALPISQQIDTGLQWLPRLSPFAFADYGAVWNPSPSPYKFASLSSAGLGLSVSIGGRLIATGLVAQPLTHEHQLAALGVEQSTRIRVTLGLRF